MSNFWPETDRQAYLARLANRYALIVDTRLKALAALQSGDTMAYAAFAHDIGWWEDDPTTEVLQKAGVTHEQLKVWSTAYMTFPIEERQRAEATLPFIGRITDEEYKSWQAAQKGATAEQLQEN